MNNKKTFWMNVFFAIAWALLCLLLFATDIDYVERTVTHNILIALVQLFIVAVPIITAIFLCKPANIFVRKLALLGNYGCAFGIIFLLLATVYKQPSVVMRTDFLFVFLFYFFVIIPFVINLKAIRAS